MTTGSPVPLRPALAIAAAAAPSLLAYNVPPSPTFLNQALAVALWGWFVIVCEPFSGAGGRGPQALLGTFAILLAAVCWSWGPGTLPTGLALSALGLLLAAAVLAAGGAAAQSRDDAERAFGDFCLGWAVAGAFNVAIALVQVFAPDWADGDWIAHSSYPGRAVGNMRQPNHLSSLLMWSTIATVTLAELGRLRRRVAVPLAVACVFGVVLTASRTGLVSVLGLAVWALLDRRLSRPTRVLLLATPLVYAATWAGMAEWARLSDHAFGGTARLAESDISSSRFAIWNNTLAMIRQQPWAGTGFGEFNFAWTLTPFPGRPVAFFDHAHNLPLQLAAELGVPAALVIMALLLGALAAGFRLARRSEGAPSLARRSALVMVLMIGLHSLLEYPLWYAYFLLPASWALAYAAAESPWASLRTPSRTLPAAALALVAGAVLSVFDYQRVTAIFSAEPGTPPLEQRIAAGRRSVLFAHHAAYAAATTSVGGNSLAPFGIATHYLLDTRLMMAWAKALAAHGEVEQARAVAARLREFRNPNAEEFFEPCEPGAAASAPEGEAASSPEAAEPAASAPFQCEAPQRAHDWREFATP